MKPTFNGRSPHPFAWLCAIGLLALIGPAVARPRKDRSTMPVPAREPQPTH